MVEYIVFPCRCGRDLRAKGDLVGTTITCWSCRAEVPVPRAKPEWGRGLDLFVGLRDVFRAVVILPILLGALLLSCTLPIPVVGGPAVLALLAVVAMAYREGIRLSGLQGAPVAQEPAWRAWAVRGFWGLVIALGLTAPVLLRHAIMDHYGRLIPLRGAGVAAATLGWIVVPLVVLIASACDRSGPLTARAALAVVLRHPIATIAGLLIVPAGLVLLESALLTIAIQQDWFPFLMVDLFPVRTSDTVPFAAPSTPDILFPDHAPLSEFFRVYTHGLRLGYTLMGTVPASLPRFPNTRVSPWFPLSFEWGYLAMKVFLSTVTLAGVTFLLAIQARWLGLIPTLDARRDADPARPNP